MFHHINLLNYYIQRSFRFCSPVSSSESIYLDLITVGTATWLTSEAKPIETPKISFPIFVLFAVFSKALRIVKRIPTPLSWSSATSLLLHATLPAHYHVHRRTRRQSRRKHASLSAIYIFNQFHQDTRSRDCWVQKRSLSAHTSVHASIHALLIDQHLPFCPS